MNFEEKINHGFQLFQDKDIDHALDIARELQKENRREPEAYYLEALIMQHLNQYDLSMKKITKALELDTENAAYYNLRGNVHMQKEAPDKAEDDFKKAIELADYSAAHRNMVMVMLMTDRGHEAIPYLINRIKQDPRDAENWILMGDMIKRGGQKDKALTYYEQALKIDPENEYAKRQMEDL